MTNEDKLGRSCPRQFKSKRPVLDIYYDQMVECCRWIYARVLPDWSCPTKKLIEMIPIVSRLCLTVYFHKLENVIIDRLKNSTLHIGLRFGIQALEICEQHNAKRKKFRNFWQKLILSTLEFRPEICYPGI